MDEQGEVTRREFLKTATTATAVLVLPRLSEGASQPGCGSSAVNWRNRHWNRGVHPAASVDTNFRGPMRRHLRHLSSQSKEG